VKARTGVTARRADEAKELIFTNKLENILTMIVAHYSEEASSACPVLDILDRPQPPNP
jgi:hypothetical protein